MADVIAPEAVSLMTCQLTCWFLALQVGLYRSYHDQLTCLSDLLVS